MNILVKNTKEFVEEGRIQLIKVKQNTKQPVGKGWQEQKHVPYEEIEGHNGNIGIQIGYNHKINGSSVCCIDIDGFKLKGANLNKIDNEVLDDLTEEAKEDITLGTKEYIFNLLKDEFSNALHVKTQSGGYHIYLFNKVCGFKPHEISTSFCFPEDYPIEFLRGVSLGGSIEVWAESGRQCVFPPSKIGENKYELLDSGVDNWENVETVQDINTSIKKVLVNNGFTKNSSTSSYRKSSTHNIEGAGLISIISNILKNTEGEHNTALMCLTNIINDYYTKENTEEILYTSLQRINDYTSEHRQQIKMYLADNRKNKYGKTKLKSLLGENNEAKVGELVKELELDNYINMKNVKIVQEGIETEGFISYLSKYLDKVMIGSHKPVFKMFFSTYGVISGKESVLMESLGDAEAGKGLLFKLNNEMFPRSTFVKYDSITLPAFMKLGHYQDKWNKKVIYFGDNGGENDDEDLKEIINRIKQLITDKETNRTLVSNKTGYATEEGFKVESIGALYETVKGDMWGNDAQLESRKVSITPSKVESKEVMNFIAKLHNPNSKVAKEYKLAIKELNRMKDYIKNNLDYNNIIITPFTEELIEYSIVSDKPKREINRQLNLFECYCAFTKHECIEYNGVLLPSSNQFNDYIDFVADDSVLRPAEHSFIMDLLDLGFTIPESVTKHYEEAYISTEPKKGGYNDEGHWEYCMIDFTMNTLTNLDNDRLDRIIKSIISNYGVEGDKVPTYFTVKSLKRKYRNRKAFKNIGDLSNMLDYLYKLGFLDQIPHQYNSGSRNKENVYYLTEKVNDLLNIIHSDLTEEDIINKYLSEIE